MATFTVGRHPEKIIQRVLKINDKATLKAEALPFSVLLQDHAMLFPPAY